MKKNHNFQLTIQKKGFSQNKSGALMGTFCSFLLFFFACGSCLLNFSLIFHPGFSILSTAELCVIPAVAGTFLFALRGREKFSYFLFGSLGILLLALYLFREDFFRQFFSAAGALEKLVRAAYNLSIFPGYTDNVKDKWILCFFLISLYMLFVLLSMLWKKRLLFVLLLGLPGLISYLLEVSVPVALFALPLGAFILWRGALWPQSVSRLWLLAVPFQGILFLTAACVFAPLFSPWVFQASESLSACINTAGNRLLSGGETSPAPSTDRKGTDGPGTFSYEAQTDSQQITSSPPSYTSQNVLSLSIDGEISQPLYLRGFVGADYADYQWTPPLDEEWYSYAGDRGIARQLANGVFPLPLFGIPEEDRLSISIEFSHAPDFTYLPLVSVSSNVTLSESNVLQDQTSLKLSGRCFPLTLDRLSEIPLGNFYQGNLDLAKAYEAFCRDRYTFWDEDPPEALVEELRQLPVYASISEVPSDEEIQKAAEEIQNFLRNHASYSLSLEPFSQSIPLSQELLYEQKRGFCIHFATVGTQLFRMYGIPARYVTGYSVLPDMLRTDPQMGYTAQVPDSRAHAWVEVYTQSAGWIPVEVTPSAQLPVSQTEDTNETVPQDMPEEETPDNTDEENSGITGNEGKDPGVLGTLAAVGKGLLIAIVVLGTLVLLLLFVRRLLFRFRLGYFAGSPTQAYLTVFKNLIRLWELEFSLEIRTSTDREYFRLLSEKLPDPLKEEFATLYTEAETFAYGQKKPFPAQLGNLRRYYLQQRKTYIAGKKGLEKLSSLLV